MSKVDKLILGTVQFGLNYGINNSKGLASDSEIFKILDKAYASGIKTLDSAEAYGNAHNIISKYHEQSTNRFKIITKYSTQDLGYNSDLLERVKEHCESFKIDKLWGYMFHSFTDFKKALEIDKTILSSLNSSRFVEKVGVSLYTNDELEDVLTYSEVQLIQLPFNLLDNHYYRKDILKRAKAKGIEIHTRSSFLQGLFFKDINTLEGNVLELRPYLEQVNNVAEMHTLKMSTLALNYPISKTYIDNVLIGVDSIDQLDENIQTLNESFNRSVYNTIDKIESKPTERLNPATWRV